MHWISITLLRNKVAANQAIFKNTLYLYIFQLVNYALPLVTIPYLIRVLGTNVFGIVAFYSSLILYFQVIVDYGFNLSATRQVALYKNNIIKISELFYAIIAIKSVLTFASTLILIVLIFCIPRFQAEKELCLWLFVGVTGSILFPYWIFQGMEDMKIITMFNVINRCSVSLLYFVFITSPQKYLWFAYLNSIGTILMGIIGAGVAIKKYHIRFLIPSRTECMTTIKDGFQIFVSQISVCLFTNTNTFLLGIFSNTHIVGTYAVAEKIIRAVISLTGPIGSSIYPRTSRIFSQSSVLAIEFLKKVTIFGVGIFSAFSLVLFIFADFFVIIVSGKASSEISALIRIMSILPVSVFLDNIFGTQIMLNLNMKKQFMWIIVFGGLLSVGLLLLLVPYFKATGSAISFVVSEFFILFFMIFIVCRSRKVTLDDIFKKKRD
jgi:polysaccharide transporter, PST family